MSAGETALLRAIEELRADLDDKVKFLSGKLDEQAGKLDVQGKDLRALGEELEIMGRRVGAIERFPYPGINQPPRLYGTEAHSVSSPRRVRAGYAG